MNGRTYERQSEHDSLVRMMVNYYATQGYLSIRADLENSSRPEKIWWSGRENQAYIPDVTCNMNDRVRTTIILEAETCETLGSDHTRAQWSLFSAHAIQIGGQFHVAVPRLCSYNNRNVTGESLVRMFANQWGVTVHRTWWPSE